MEFKSGVLHINGISVVDLVERFGTPVYVYDGSVILRQMENVKRAFADLPFRPFYAMKANSNRALLSLFASLGGGADIVSGGEGSELYRVDLPSAYIGLTVDDLSTRLRSEHHATLLAISRAIERNDGRIAHASEQNR